MKKILFFSVIALAVSCCGPKSKEVCVDKLIANPAEFVGKDIKFVGTAAVTNAEEKRIAVFGSDSTKYIMVQGLDSAKVCGSLCGQKVKVAGTVVAVDCCKKDGEKKCCKKDGEEKKACPASKE